MPTTADYEAEGLIDRKGPIGDIYSLHAVHSPDDGGWYCEVWYHLNDQKRTVCGHEVCDGVHASAEAALGEGRAVGRDNSRSTKPFHESRSS